MSDAAQPTLNHRNRLADESSPYLLQHAHNPVNWYPWGPVAFAAARQQNKPIFLSVGYSTCYWCHVMERQSFENESIAAEMNERFINVKVDREERPDVDQLYMTAVQVLTRHGGWPMSVWLTPDLRPFYGGTYFPPEDYGQRPGFRSVIRGLADAYHNRRSDVEQTANQLVDILGQMAEPPAPEREVTIDEGFIDRLIERSISDYDDRLGGFGAAPKFPRQTLLELLLSYCLTLAGDSDLRESRTDERRTRILRMVRHTMDAMASGGIRDHLGGGFHRYSTDAQWLVPHFEIMLYDNAMLAWCYAELYRQTEDLRYAQVARGILDFVLREMTSPAGAFYTAIDAEVDAQEGLTYLWTADEIEQILGPEDATLFNRVYGVDQGPNFADPHHGSGVPDKSILFLAHPDEAEEHHDRLEAMRQELYAARRQRKQPITDTKIITSWNALMIRALAYTGNVLGEQRYLDAAARAADYLLRQHRQPDGSLIRTSGGGRLTRHVERAPGEEVYVATPTTSGEFVEPPVAESRETRATDVMATDAPPRRAIAGFLDDYSFLIQALIALRDASGGEHWKDHAAALAIQMLSRFGDEAGGFYFTDAAADDLIVRQMIATDIPLPSGAAVAGLAMLELGHAEESARVLRRFARLMEHHGEAMSAMVQLALSHTRQHGSLSVPAGPSTGAEDEASPLRVAGGVVTIKPTWPSPTQLVLQISILDEFHINAHEASAGLIPTSLNVSGDGFEVVSIDYPPGEGRSFAFADKAIRVYDREIEIAVRFKTPPTGRVRLSLTYQACTDEACLPPVTKRMDVHR